MQQAPSGPVDPRPLGTTALPGKAYSPGQVGFAALVGGPIAGFIVLASNFALFWAPKQRRQALLWGLVSEIALLVLVLVLPDRFPVVVVPMICIPALVILATRTQGAHFDEYIQSGGVKHSHWRVFGIGLLCFGVRAICLVLLGVGLALTGTDSL